MQLFHMNSHFHLHHKLSGDTYKLYQSIYPIEWTISIAITLATITSSFQSIFLVEISPAMHSVPKMIDGRANTEKMATFAAVLMAKNRSTSKPVMLMAMI